MRVGPPIQERIMIVNCTCRHAYQDQKYGKGRRVHTVGKDDKKARCTVCEDEKTL